MLSDFYYTIINIKSCALSQLLKNMIFYLSLVIYNKLTDEYRLSITNRYFILRKLILNKILSSNKSMLLWSRQKQNYGFINHSVGDIIKCHYHAWLVWYCHVIISVMPTFSYSSIECSHRVNIIQNYKRVQRCSQLE